MLRIEERPVGDVMILDMRGTIAAGDAERNLRDKVNRVILRGYRKALLNLADVSNWDISGISGLIEALLEMRDAGGELKLLHVTRQIKALPIVVALHGHFSVFDSERDALSSFGS